MALYTDYRQANTTVTDAKAINNAIRNILFTPRGSLPGKPTFGSRLNEILFEQIDDITINIIKTFIKEALNRWEPRIAVTRVTVKEVPEYNKVIATIEYRYKDKGLDINESISVSLIE